jgi:hypothetical protein
MFVANTDQALIARSAIERSGAPAEPEVVASGPALGAVRREQLALSCRSGRGPGLARVAVATPGQGR